MTFLMLSKKMIISDFYHSKVDDVSMFIPKVDEFWGLSPQVDGSSMFIPLDLMISHLYPSKLMVYQCL